MRRFPAVATLFVAFASAAMAQEVRPPLLGFVFDSAAGGIRPILGIPGASSLGPLVPSTTDLVRAVISPRNDFVLALAGESRDVVLLRPEDLAEPRRKLEEAGSGAEAIVLSPQATAAAILFKEPPQARILTGLPGQPSVARTIELASLTPAGRIFAISDDGSILLASNATEQEGADQQHWVEVLHQTGAGTRIPLSSPVASLSFMPGRHDALVGSGSAVVLVSDVAGEARVARLNEETAPFGKPVALAVSDDVDRVIVADQGSRRIVLLSLRNEPAVAVDCFCEVTAVSSMRRQLAFRVTDYSGDPLWILDRSGPQPRLVFVPPYREPDPEP